MAVVHTSTQPSALGRSPSQARPNGLTAVLAGRRLSMMRNHPRKRSAQGHTKPNPNKKKPHGVVSITPDWSPPCWPRSLIATRIVAAPPPSYSADEPDSASASSSEDSDEFTTRPADKKNGRKRAKPKSQSAGFEMPRISSRNGKELPNYNEAEAFNFSDEESEEEYVSAKQKRIDDRKPQQGEHPEPKGASVADRVANWSRRTRGCR